MIETIVKQSCIKGDVMRNAWTLESLLLEAKKYNTRFEFQKNNHGAYESARIKGILPDITGHMIPTHVLKSKLKNSMKWNEEKLFKEALNYTTRLQFKLSAAGAYKAAIRLNLLEKVCIHMKVSKKQWTNNELLREASLFDTRQEFARGNRKAYEIAIRRRIIDEACKHMKRSTRISAMEKELLNMIREVFPEARTLGDHRVNILDKPHIKRFEIDIFVQSSMKGIEFDGTYYHSVAGLRRGRKHWPIEDVINYHQIKDEYFLNTRNIKILHIKEADWIKNKQKCIKKCLKFLNG